MDDQVGAVVAALDHLPLAIELVAARAGVLSTGDLARRLEDQLLRMAARSRRDAPDRHSTLRAAIDWSWELLDEEERRAMALCSVFRGGFDLSAAEAVLWEPEASDPLDLVQTLWEKSLVGVTRDGDEVRFAMLASLREYGAERCVELGLDRLAEDAHGGWFAALAEERAERIYLTGEVEAGAELRRDRANLLAVVDRLAERRPDVAARTLRAIGSMLVESGPLDVQLARVDRVVLPVGDTISRAHLAVLRGRLLRYCGRFAEAEASLAASVEGYRAVGDGPGLRMALRYLGGVRVDSGNREQGLACLAEATELARLDGTPLEVGQMLDSQARIWMEQGRMAEAHRCSTEAVALLEDAPAFLGIALGGLAMVTRAPREAMAINARAMRIVTETGQRYRLGVMWLNQASWASEIGDFEEAVEMLHKSREILREVGNVVRETIVVASLAAVRAKQRELSLAEPLARQAVSLAKRTESPVNASYALGALACVLQLRGRLDEVEVVIEESRPYWPKTPPPFPMLMRMQLALLSMERGDVGPARVYLDEEGAGAGPTRGLVMGLLKLWEGDADGWHAARAGIVDFEAELGLLVDVADHVAAAITD